MEIVEYQDADPLGVLRLNLLGLNYALTPERMATILRLDPRPFPFFGVYAIQDGIVAGQVGVYRLPMLSIDGPEEVGGACAVCTHPAFNRRGVATLLLTEAHARMRAAGLRFSTLGTSRYLVAHRLYQSQGYVDVFSPNVVFARLEDVGRETHLRAGRAGEHEMELAEEIFERAAAGYLGFARRHRSFLSILVATGDLPSDEVWLLWDGFEPVGYALVNIQEDLLRLNSLLLVDGVEAAAAVSALAQDKNISYLQIRIDQPSVLVSLRQAGYPCGVPGWSTFMIKPLVPGATVELARRLFGIGTERFLISYIDVT